MKTPVGPRINRNRWDFHDGVDMPAPLGTPIHAVCDGTVYHAGDGGTGGYSSRHIVVESKGPDGEKLYVLYFHLSKIANAITAGASVSQGQQIGEVGDDDATYPHLHLEFRKGTHKQIGSVHPLHYLPYADTPNFLAPISGGFNCVGGLIAARLLFSAPSKLEGDLAAVE